MPTFHCFACRQDLECTEEEEARALEEARARYGCDPDPARFSRVCEVCAENLAVFRLASGLEHVIPIARKFHGRCPNCGDEGEDVDELTTSPSGPRPDGFLVCTHCGAVAVVTAEMTLRPALAEDLLSLHETRPANFSLLLAIATAVRARLEVERQP
jgi:hypothetical protein